MEMYVNRLEQIDAEGGPDWESENETIRLLAGLRLLEQHPLHEVPFSVVHELIVIPHFVDAGMSDGPRAAWLDELLGYATSHLQAASKDEAKSKSHLPSRQKGGHPPPKAFNHGVVIAAYLGALHDLPSASENQLFERVLARLGPGIGRNGVRREALRFRRQLGATRGETGDLLLKAALTIVDMLATIDEANPPPRDDVSKQTPSLRYLRTRPLGNLGSPQSGDPR